MMPVPQLARVISLVSLVLSVSSSVLPQLRRETDMDASRAPIVRKSAAQPAAVARLLVGGGPTGLIGVAEFDGSSFEIVANNTDAGTSASWQLFREGSNQLYAVDENSDTTRLFNIDAASNQITHVQDAQGSAGVVCLAFNQDRTRMAGAAYGAGALDFWDVSAPDGSLNLIKSISVPNDTGPNPDQDGPHPHQVLLDPTGRFFVAPDLGTDRILVVDTLDDSFEITNSLKVPQAGSGPRHAVFYPPGAPQATHYILLCETMNLIEVFEVEYAGNTINFTPAQELSSFGADFPPANPSTAAAGEIQISPDGKDVYVSNRLTGNDTDSVARFGIASADDGSITLQFRDTVSSGGILPRMFSLGRDGFEDYVFLVNQQGDNALMAFQKADDGSLAPQPVASLPLSVFADPTSSDGPQFVQQIPI